jgi:hypothetical protein
MMQSMQDNLNVYTYHHGFVLDPFWHEMANLAKSVDEDQIKRAGQTTHLVSSPPFQIGCQGF